MKNWAARRRRSRQVEARQAANAREANAAKSQATDGPAAIVMPESAAADGSPTGELEDCSIRGFPVGIHVPKGGYTTAKNLDVSGCDTGVDNHGRFDSTDSELE